MKEQKLSGNTRKMVMTAMLSAVATALMFAEFPIPFLLPSFLKFDFSELPALIASFAIGPVWGAAVCLVKNLVHLSATMTGGVGELCSFLLGAAFVVPAGVIYRFHRTRRGALVGAGVGAVTMAALSLPLNLFVTYPIYAVVFVPGATVQEGLGVILGLYQVFLPFVQSIAQCLLLFNLPFTLAKGLIDALIAFLIYKPLSRFIQGKGGAARQTAA